MKLVKAAALATLVATPSLAGGLSDPVMEVTPVEAAASSSNGGIIVPILALVLLALVLSD